MGLDLGRYGLALEGCLLLCATETITREQIDALVAVVSQLA